MIVAEDVAGEMSVKAQRARLESAFIMTFVSSANCRFTSLIVEEDNALIRRTRLQRDLDPGRCTCIGGGRDVGRRVEEERVTFSESTYLMRESCIFFVSKHASPILSTMMKGIVDAGSEELIFLSDVISARTLSMLRVFYFGRVTGRLKLEERTLSTRFDNSDWLKTTSEWSCDVRRSLISLARTMPIDTASP